MKALYYRENTINIGDCVYLTPLTIWAQSKNNIAMGGRYRLFMPVSHSARQVPLTTQSILTIGEKIRNV